MTYSIQRILLGLFNTLTPIQTRQTILDMTLISDLTPSCAVKPESDRVGASNPVPKRSKCSPKWQRIWAEENFSLEINNDIANGSSQWKSFYIS